MSNVSNIHDVVPFVAGKSIPFTGQRLAKVGYKSSKNQTARYASVCVSVPTVTVDIWEGNTDRIAGHINAMIENAQDGIIRSLYESADGALSQVTDSDISFNAIVSYLDAQALGDRLTKEAIESWFDVNVKENLTVTVAEKLKYEELTVENLPTVNKHVKVYRELLSMLAGGKTFLTDTQIKGCQNAVALANTDDEMSTRLNKRLDMMLAKPKIEDLLEL